MSAHATNRAGRSHLPTLPRPWSYGGAVQLEARLRAHSTGTLPADPHSAPEKRAERLALFAIAELIAQRSQRPELSHGRPLALSARSVGEPAAGHWRWLHGRILTQSPRLLRPMRTMGLAVASLVALAGSPAAQPDCRALNP